MQLDPAAVIAPDGQRVAGEGDRIEVDGTIPETSTSFCVAPAIEATAVRGAPLPSACDRPPYLFTAPPYGALVPVPGVSLRVIDKATFVITNLTSFTYFVGVTSWATEDDLVCGRGVIGRTDVDGRLGPGSTLQLRGGSSAEIPATVEIWSDPCGEGCSRPPVGEYLLPISTVEPPAPLST